MIGRFLPLNEEEKRAIIDCIPIVEFKKGHLLLVEGQIARDSYFNIKGLVREYYIIDGDEKTTNFFMEDEFGKQQQALANFITSTPEQRYLNLLENNPGLLQRVPQYYLASYLGIKPESLSRIRKRIIDRSK